MSNAHTLTSSRCPLTLLAIATLLLSSCALSGCRDNDTKTEEDMSPAREDMAAGDMQAADMVAADMRPDQGPAPDDMGVDADMQDPLDSAQDLDTQDLAQPEDMRPTCEGDCATHSLTIEFGADTRTMERAVYGLSSPEQSVNGEGWEIYVEALEGGFAGCPEELSPSPDYTLILSGLPLLVGGEVLSKETAPINAILFDYKEDLISGFPPRTVATELTITARAASVCVDCVGATPAGGDMDNSDPEGFVSLEIEATFPEGTIKGTLYAAHCDSLDAK